jgi:solute carrier family 10 (sodium/bile acid cotransporter), member 7
VGSLFSGRVQSGWPVSHPDFVRACVWGAQKRDQSGGEPAIVLQLLVPFVAGQLSRPWIGRSAERNRSILSITDRGSILPIVYTAFSASVVEGLWQRVPVATLATLALIDAVLLAAALLIMISGSRVMRFDRADQSAIVFCGSQKSVVSGIPIANALIPGPALGLFGLPIMLYHSLQLLVCAWLAMR